MKLLTALISLLIALALPSIAVAAEIYPSFAPAVLRGTPPWTTTYTFEIHTGPQAEHLNFTGWGDAELDGPGEIRHFVDVLVSAQRTCAFGRGDFTSGIGAGGYYHLDLPAETSTRLIVRETRTFPFGVGEPSENRFEIGSTSSDWTPADGRGDLTPINVGSPQIATAREPWIYAERKSRLDTAPRGKRIALTGKALPALEGRMVEFVYTKVWPPRWVRIAGVRVQPGGSFTYAEWAPRTGGIYSVSARFNSHDARFVSTESTSCPDSFRVL